MTAVGDVLRIPAEPPVRSVVRADDGEEWTNKGGIWPWQNADGNTALDWHQLLNAFGRVVVVAVGRRS